jgi:rfaE bifunctional protein nucleotidyltransferase chain/domain
MRHSNTLLSKIVSFDELLAHLTPARAKGLSVVFTNGCFDVLHKGHIDYLYQASAYGDILVVGLNSDSSVRSIKGSGRPLQDEASRSVVLASLFFVDFVVLFHEDTPFNLISGILPDVLIKGGDYKAEEIVGYDLVSGHGGKVVIIPFVEGYSTTSVLERLKKSMN